MKDIGRAFMNYDRPRGTFHEARCQHQELATCLVSIVVSMEELQELHLQCRQTFKLQYENVRSQLIGPAFYDESIKAKDKLKLERERLQNFLVAEEKKAWRVMKLKREREKQELRELHSQQLELSDLHSCRRCLHHYGWIPWKKMILSIRLLEERALLHSAISLLKRTLLHWKKLMSSQDREILMNKKLLYMRAAYFRKKWHQRSCWSAWLRLHRAEKEYQQALLGLCFSSLKETCSFGAAQYEAYLLKETWFDWLHQVNVLKATKLMTTLASERIAAEHAQRTLQMRVFRSWHEAAKRTTLEKEKIKRHAEAWCKIQSWLDELNQGQGNKATSKVVHDYSTRPLFNPPLVSTEE